MSRKRVKREQIEEISLKQYITFSFDFLHEVSFTDCKNASFFIQFFKRLKILSSKEWNEIETSSRHSFGYERITIKSIKKDLHLTQEVSYLYAFRATGDNHVFLGFREGSVFKIVFIETSFGDIYDHGTK